MVDDDTVSILTEVLISVMTSGNGGGDEVDSNDKMDSDDKGDMIDPTGEIGSGDEMIIGDEEGSGDGVAGDASNVSRHVKVDDEVGDGSDGDVDND